MSRVDFWKKLLEHCRVKSRSAASPWHLTHINENNNIDGPVKFVVTFSWTERSGVACDQAVGSASFWIQGTAGTFKYAPHSPSFGAAMTLMTFQVEIALASATGEGGLHFCPIHLQTPTGISKPPHRCCATLIQLCLGPVLPDFILL